MAISIFPVSDQAEELAPGRNYSFKFEDVDGNKFSTTDGRVNVVVLVTAAHIEKAEQVGDRIPDYCLGNPAYRMTTVVTFQKHGAPIRVFLKSMAQRRLDGEAKRLQARYREKNINRDARHDVSAVTDFDGVVASQLGGLSDTLALRVFVFSRTGELLAQWSDVPTATELAAVVK